MMLPPMLKSARLVFIITVLFVAGCGGGSDIVIMDFESERWGYWKTSGQSFGEGPAKGGLEGQRTVSGYEGSSLANSYYEGEKAQGTLISPEFTIQRPYINFLIGGGDHEGETCINLLVNGKAVRSRTGRRDDTLISAYWDVTDLKGKQARIEIVDSYSREWGFVLVDQIVQSMNANAVSE